MPIVRRRQPGTARQDPSPVRRRLFSDQVWHAAHRLPRLPPCGLSPSLRNPVAPSRTGTPFPVSDALGFAPTRVSARPPIFCTCEILPRFLTKCTEHRHPPTGMVRVACGRCACDVEVGRCFALGVCEGRQAVGDVKTRRIPLCLADNAAEELSVVRRALWASRLMLSETTDSFLTDSPTHRLTGSRTHRLTSSPYSNMSFFAHELRRRSVWA